MKKIFKNEIGITLIALVITIIILLILAGITISQLTGTGLFDKSSEAKLAQREAQVKEEVELKIYEATIENNGHLTLQSFAQYLDKDDKNTYVIEVGETATIDGEIPDLSNAKSMILTYKNFQFEITDKMEVTCLGENLGIRPKIQVYILTEGLVQTGTKVEVEVIATIDEGNIEKIEVPEGVTLKEGNIYEIAANGTYKITAVGNNGTRTSYELTINNIISEPEIILNTEEQTTELSATVDWKMADSDKVIKEVSTDGTNYVQYSGPITIKDNGNIYARILNVETNEVLSSSNKTISNYLYQWEVYSLNTITTYVENQNPNASSGFTNTKGYCLIGGNATTASTWDWVTMYDNYKIVDGLIVGDGTSYTYSGSQYRSCVGKYYINSKNECGKIERVMISTSNPWSYPYLMTDCLITVKAENAYTKGEQQYENQTDTNKTTYPEDGQQGDYWYVLKK